MKIFEDNFWLSQKKIEEKRDRVCGLLVARGEKFMWTIRFKLRQRLLLALLRLVLLRLALLLRELLRELRLEELLPQAGIERVLKLFYVRRVDKA
jgi:hypothetical protein